MGADYLNPQILEKMTHTDVIQRFCKLMGEAQDYLGWDHAADCFCFKSQFSEFDYRNDGKSVEFIEAAVREKIKREKSNIDSELLEALEMLIAIEPNYFSADAYERNLWQNARETIAKATKKK